jgi:hypothetical protein
MLWYGRCNHHILGTANPTLEAVLVTWFPNPRALNQAMNDSKRNDYMQSIRPYLAYTASSLKDIFLE